MYSYNYYPEENGLVIEFKGRLDTLASTQYSDPLSRLISDHVKKHTSCPLLVQFDLNDVDYISSAFIRICIKTVKDVNRENFSIINTKPMIKKIFKVAGLDSVLEIK